MDSTHKNIDLLSKFGICTVIFQYYSGNYSEWLYLILSLRNVKIYKAWLYNAKGFAGLARAVECKFDLKQFSVNLNKLNYK